MLKINFLVSEKIVIFTFINQCSLNMNNLEKMQHIVETEMSQHGIVVKRWSKSSCGSAYHGTTEIKIPKPVDFDTLGVCFHEIGHVVLGHLEKNDKTRYVEEYEAEQFAIQKLKDCGFYNKQYEYRAMAYVLSKIAQARNRGHNMKKVPKEIVKWAGLQVNKWNKAKKVFVSLRDYKRKGDIKIYFSNS